MADKLDAIREIEQDHRNITDGLFEMISALERQDMAAGRGIFEKINVLVGPHFRYEEEVLYPKLRIFFGDNVDQLFKEHDVIIATFKVCAGLLKKNRLTSDEGRQLLAAIHDMMFHVSNCDGLSIFAERLSQGEREELDVKLAAVRKDGHPLLEWMDTVRPKSRRRAFNNP